MYLLTLIVVLSYLAGSIPTSLLISKMVSGIDIRNHGSGNAGGTNVWRVLGWKYGLLVIILDALKGVLAVVLIARLHYGNFPFSNLTPFDDFTLVQIIAGTAAVIGHVWSIFADFRGGKGIATGLGILITIVTVDILVALGVFLIVLILSRYVSLGSILAALSIPLTMIIRENIFNVDITGYNTLLPFMIAISIFVLYTHRKNIVRIMNGNETKVRFSRKSGG
ncbi:MAG: glycerol-3-phosphate 1-O-acyltransferase PlsY [Ignavibacteriaceae bacterium]